MLEGLPILSLITFIPLAGALMLMFMARISKEDAQEQLAKQFVEDTSWLGGGIDYRLGVDGISVLFVLLTAFLTPLCIFASEKSIKDRMLEYMVAFLILETLMIGTFVALDLILFYLFFEAVLIPMFIIIGVWGGKNRVYASYKFFLYTLLGSVLMLAAILWIYNFSGQQLGAPTTNMETLINDLKIPGGVQAP